jgi:hypothetical protein
VIRKNLEVIEEEVESLVRSLAWGNVNHADILWIEELCGQSETQIAVRFRSTYFLPLRSLHAERGSAALREQ